MLNRLCRIILSFFVLCLGIIGAGIIGYALLAGPPQNPHDQIVGLNAPVTIALDDYAIPTIKAKNDLDAARALGYLHARHRLFQMEMMRRTGQGRLAEWLGPSALKFDRYIRALNLYRLAQKSVAAAPKDEQAILEAYAAGVNSWITAHHRWPPFELWLIGLAQGRLNGPELAPWTPADSVVWGKLMALQLSGNLPQEIRRAHLLEYYGADVVSLLTRFDTPLPSLPRFAESGIDWQKLAASIPKLGPERASNAWVLHGSRTTTGKPILANDPHLGLNAPILWYLARIETPTQKLAGVTVPGVPFHILGQNAHIAWGFTTTGSDVNDLVLEKLVPGKPDFYQTEDGPRQFDTRTETISILGGKTETQTIRTSRHGVILSDLRPDLRPAQQSDIVVALQTTLNVAEDTTWRALYHLNRVQNQDDFVKAVQMFQLGQQNIFYADRAGNIGFYTQARLPVRPFFDGSTPAPGWTGRALWRGWRAAKELPPVFNPPDGVLANANDAIAPLDAEPALTQDWEAPWRARRLHALLQKRAIHHPDDQKAIMTDDYSMVAEDLLPILLKAPAATKLQETIIAQMGLWDRHMDREQPEPLIFTAWIEAIQEILLEGRPGDLLNQFTAIEPRLILRLLTQPQAGWCDIPQTDQKQEDCTDIIQQGLTRALSRLQIRYGTDWQAWRWGTAHHARLVHPLFGQVPWLDNVFTWGGPMSGASDTLLRAAFMDASKDMNYHAVHGAGYRAIYDLAAPDNSQMILATGQEGRPFQPHFADMTPFWLEKQFLRPLLHHPIQEMQLNP